MILITFITSDCNAASYPTSTATALSTDLSMNQYKLYDMSDVITKGPWVDARIYNGGAFNNTTISAAITDIGSANKTLLLAPGTWTISANVTVPPNINLRFEQGAILSIGGAYIFTINGPLDAPLSQIFSGGGEVSIGSGYIERLYPQWWGAKGDGVTDNRNTIQSTINAALNSKSVVYFPAGTYIVSSASGGPQGGEEIGFVLQAGVTLIGSREGSIIKLASSQSTTNWGIVDVDSDASIFNMIFDGNGSNQTEGAAFYQSGIYACDANNIRLVNVTVRNAKHRGFFLTNITDSIIRDCIAHDNGFYGIQVRAQSPNISSGVELTGCSAWSNGANVAESAGITMGDYTYQCFMTNCYSYSNTGQGFHLERAQKSSVVGCIAKGNSDTGIHVGWGCEGLSVIGSTAVGNSGSGFKITSYEVTFRGCVAEANSINGFYLTDALWVDLDMQSKYNQQHGILMEGGDGGGRISGLIVGNSQSGAGVYSGILLKQNPSTLKNVTHWNLSSLFIDGYNFQKYGIREDTTSQNYNLVDGVVALRNTTAQISLRGPQSKLGDNQN